MQNEFILMAFDLVCETVIYSALNGIVREKWVTKRIMQSI